MKIQDFTKEYTDIAQKCEDFAKSLLDRCTTKHEVSHWKPYQNAVLVFLCHFSPAYSNSQKTSSLNVICFCRFRPFSRHAPTPVTPTPTSTSPFLTVTKSSLLMRSSSSFCTRNGVKGTGCSGKIRQGWFSFSLIKGGQAWSMEFSVWSFHSWINLWIISYNIFWSEMSGLGKFVHFLKQMFVFPFLPFVVLFSSCLTNCFPCTWFSRQSQIPVNRYARYFKLSQHTVKLDDKAFAWWNGPANISLTNDLSKKYM